jgi:DNA-binding protein WhiA
MKTVDYAARIKRDLISLMRQSPVQCCHQSFLAGLLQGSRCSPFIRVRRKLQRRVLEYCQQILPVSQEVCVKGTRINFPDLDQMVLREKFVDRIRIISDSGTANHCHIAFLRGLFVSRGYIQSPSRGYHLEFRLNSRWLTTAFRKMAAHLRQKFCVYKNQQYSSFYMKSGRRITRFLNLLGLFDRGLEFSDLRATRNLLSMVNRQVNSETANINRLISAAESSINHIHELLAHPDQEIWTESLHQMAQMRLKFPHDSIENLGKRFEPPLSKSAVNHRLRRIKALHAKIFGLNPENDQPS